MTKIHDRSNPKLDKFYDETPQVRFTFQLKVSTKNQPYELYYNERLDGDKEYNDQVIESLKVRAQADMSNILLRLQAEDDTCEFESWKVLDELGQILHVSDVLKIVVKSQVGAPR